MFVVLRRAGGALALSALAVSACSSSPTSPSPSPAAAAGVTGTWISADGAFRWNLVQSGTVVTGTETTLPAGTTTPIAGRIEEGEFRFSIVYSEEIVDWGTGPLLVQSGRSTRVDVAPSRLTGSMSWFGVPGKYPRVIVDITLVRVDGRSR